MPVFIKTYYPYPFYNFIIPQLFLSFPVVYAVKAVVYAILQTDLRNG